MRTNTTTSTGSATKALVAAGLGVVLLAGAGGTFALWSAEETAATGTITDGELSLAVADGSWTAGGEPIDNIADYRMVPGDTVTFSTSVTPTIVGDNLTAELTATLPQDETHWTVESTMTGGDGVLTAADNGQAYPVTVDVTLPEDSGNESQQATLNLGDLTFALAQTTTN